MLKTMWKSVEKTLTTYSQQNFYTSEAEKNKVIHTSNCL